MAHKILVIEDNPGDQRLAKAYLADEYDLDMAPTFGQAQESLARNEYDAILLDLSLPDSDGIQTFISLVQYAYQVPIIVLTNNPDPSLDRKLLEAGAQDFMPKLDANKSALKISLRFAIYRQTHQSRRHIELKAEAERATKLDNLLNEVWLDGVRLLGKISRAAEVNQPPDEPEYIRLIRQAACDEMNKA